MYSAAELRAELTIWAGHRRVIVHVHTMLGWFQAEVDQTFVNVDEDDTVYIQCTAEGPPGPEFPC